VTETPFRWTRQHVIALLVLCLAALLDTIDVTVVNVAMPAIRNALHFSEGGLAWMVNAYMVPFGGLLLLGGRSGDILGKRRMLLAGTALFTLASAGSALAPNAGFMVATRAAEGIAAAFVVPMTLALLAVVFPAGPARNRAFGVWGGVAATAGTLGLIAGGLLVATVGWRWIFFINLPVGALIIAVARRVLPADPPAARSAGFDAVGAIAVTAGASLLAYAIVATHWSSPATIAMLTVAAVLLSYFFFHERYIAASPLLPMQLWRNRSVTGANVISALVSGAIFAMFYSTTLYMQQVLHYSALRTGLAYIPLGLSIMIAAGLSPVLVRLAGVRLVTVAGSALGIAGLFLFTQIPATGHLLTSILIPEAITGLGGGMILVPTSIAAMSGVVREHTGVASALLNASRQLGGALGLAVIASVVASRTGTLLARGTTLGTAMTGGFHTGFAVSGALLIAAALAGIVLLREDGRGETVNMIELQAAGAGSLEPLGVHERDEVALALALGAHRRGVPPEFLGGTEPLMAVTHLDQNAHHRVVDRVARAGPQFLGACVIDSQGIGWPVGRDQIGQPQALRDRRILRRLLPGSGDVLVLDQRIDVERPVLESGQGAWPLGAPAAISDRGGPVRGEVLQGRRLLELGAAQRDGVGDPAVVFVVVAGVVDELRECRVLPRVADALLCPFERVVMAANGVKLGGDGRVRAAVGGEVGFLQLDQRVDVAERGEQVRQQVAVLAQDGDAGLAQNVEIVQRVHEVGVVQQPPRQGGGFRWRRAAGVDVQLGEGRHHGHETG
jgi:EmrB/QacA subfamily drug resistance transporter